MSQARSVAAEPFVPFCLPWIGEEEIAAVVECLRSGWLTTGPRVRRFEEQFAEYVGVGHAIAVNSCTAALHLALEALGVSAADEVLVPTMTFAATAEVVRYLGARPVLLDCEAETLNLSPELVARWLEANAERVAGGARNLRTGARVRAVIPVHYAGRPVAMEALLEVCREWGLAVIEDAAHALPCRVKGRHVGTFGEVGAFSFYATKTITTGEGGMFVTNDSALADRARMMSLHGISRDAWQRYTSKGSWYYEILEPGFKYNLTDLAAALGLEQLRRCEWLWRERCRLAAQYDAAFSDVPEIAPLPPAAIGEMHAWHLYVIRLALEELRIDRAAFMEELKVRGIGASVHFIPLHLHPYYRETYGYRPDDLPVADREFHRLVTLPLYPSLGDEGVARVAATVREITALYRR